jgi:endoglycosylceramidase
VIGRPLLALVLLSGCSSSQSEPARVVESPCKEAVSAFGTRCGQLIDAEGRVVILRGVNARVRGVFDADLGPGKVPIMPPIPELPASDLARMRRIGFDVLRLPIHWSALEPEEHEPPQFDEAYLDRVAKVVADAKAADVRVLLDFHQDAWSKWIGQDGAPLWAIVPAPTMILEGPLDLGARAQSPQVNKAFGTFFTPENADGKRLRSHFSAMVQKVAGKFAGDATVVGIDLFNEPVAADSQLRPFHEEMGAAIRKADAKRLVFFEPPGLRNLFDRATVPDSPLALEGTVYAPHVYTKVFTQGCDAACRDAFDLETLRPSNESARAEADGWKSPLVIGEWGFGPSDARYADYVGFQLDLQDQYMASSIYWVWKENDEGGWGFYDHDMATDSWTERPKARKAFARVRPRAIAGWPLSWKWESKRFELVTVGDESKAPTILWTPLPEDSTANWKITCDGVGISAARDAHGDLSLVCNGPGEHHLVVEGS